MTYVIGDVTYVIGDDVWMYDSERDHVSIIHSEIDDVSIIHSERDDVYVTRVAYVATHDVPCHVSLCMTSCHMCR